VWAAGFGVVIVDNFVNSSPVSLDRIRALISEPSLVELVTADVLDERAMNEVVRRKTFASVIHFAALKSVGESVQDPLKYYSNNIGGLISLLKAVVAAGIPSFIFSSSATVYGDGEPPFTEASTIGAVS
jgi:UDP-glucose 4-epimerase